MAVPEVLAQRITQTELDKISQRELRSLLEGLIDGIRTVTLKLDADAGVTDTNYTAVFDGMVRKQ